MKKDSKTGHWNYEGEPFDVKDYFGFIYIITNNITGHKYLGRKFFHIHQKKKRVRESPWKSYTGSSKLLNADIKKLGKENFTFDIFKLYQTRGGLSYFETYYLTQFDVLTQRDANDERVWYNRHIGAVKWIPALEISESTRYRMSEAKMDKGIYHFRKDEKCTRAELCKKYDINTGNISALISGRQKTAKGWHLVKEGD
jgi:hypothetical protein